MIGLGAIGVKVANVASDLGMHVVGFDPQITVQRAWQLSSKVQQALSVDDLLRDPTSSPFTCRSRTPLGTCWGRTNRCG